MKPDTVRRHAFTLKPLALAVAALSPLGSTVADRKYSTGGALAENPFDAGDTFQTNSGDWARETFYAPGAPRAGWIGLRYRWGA